MKKLLLLAALLALPAGASAQYSGPAVEPCRALAEADAKKNSAPGTTVRFDGDASLSIERYTRKAGSQFVSSLLTGNGAVVYAKGVPVEFSFVCLLADERRAVFFHWVPRLAAPALDQCRRTKATADCLDSLLIVAEQDLTLRYATLFVDARDADAKAGNENAVAAFRGSAQAFLAYREAECARRGAAGSEPHKACLVDLTRRRGLDLR